MRLKLRYTFFYPLAILLLNSTVLKGQNLVPNPSFESYSSCPTNDTQLYLAEPWVAPFSTPDLFHSCAGTTCGDTPPGICVPDNWTGSQLPHSGEGYAGVFVLWSFESRYAREYIQAPFLSPLEAGVNYRVSFHVSLSDKCGRSTKNFGAYISEEQITYDTGLSTFSFDDHVGFNTFVTNKISWNKISGCYKAVGNEQYITLGNFDHPNETQYLSVPGGSEQWSYYYIDDVDVRGPVDLDDEILLCEGDTITLDAFSPDADYTWQDLSTDPTYEITEPGTYWVEISDVCGTYTDTVQVNMFSQAQIELGNDTTLCDNETLFLDATFPNATYTWQDNSTSPVYEVTDEGEYWVEASLEDCMTIDSIEVFFNPSPDVQLPSDLIVCNGDSIMVNDEIQNASYVWQDGSTNSYFIPTNSGEYSVEVTMLNCTSEATVYVHFDECFNDVLNLPNIITPNNDGKNDVFAPYMREDILTMSTKIYDRWGKLVFEAEGLNIYWDGLNVNDGTYYWVITYTDMNGVVKSTSGNVTVLKE